MSPIRVLTWHVHGSYLYYLSQANVEFYLPAKPGRPEGYGGRTSSFPWPANVREAAAEDVPYLRFDAVLSQSRKNWEEDRPAILSREQLRLPQIHLQHDPPREHPSNTRHYVDDPEALIVHVTHFNQLMWDNGRTPSMVIEHGVTVPLRVRYSGEIPRGIAAVNNIQRRGRLCGSDVFAWMRERVPLDLVGMGSRDAGGLGEVPPSELAAFEARYRFFFNPIRYTSLGLAVCEAMMLGMPVLGLATTEMVTAIENGVSGYVETGLERLAAHMRRLIDSPGEARALGEGARRAARARFNIQRFASEWEALFAERCGRRPAAAVSLPIAAGGTR